MFPFIFYYHIYYTHCLKVVPSGTGFVSETDGKHFGNGQKS